MNTSKQAEKARGQALVELAVILPILVLFMVLVIPLIVKGTALPWLDERLTLRQLGQDDEQIHRVLLLTHESDLMPPYFDKTRIEESTRNTPIPMSIPVLGKIFPGDITRKLTSVTLPEHGWWNRELLGNPQEQDRQISRGLSMVPVRILTESRVPDEVKRWTLTGAVPGKTGLLEKAGFNLFHLNLDALPETGKAGGKGK